MGSVVLSERLKALCLMVTPGSSVVDVGCDHGFVSIYLVQQGISPRVLAMDVRTGPLSRAREHVAAYGLEDYIETRLSDGLLAYEKGEARTLICAGMGGRLMTKILTESREKARNLEELILQPQSELKEFRRFLKAEGYELLDENILCEDGKYYFMMKVRWRGEASVDDRTPAGKEAQGEASAKKTDAPEFSESLGERYGELLLKRKHPVLKQFLEESLQNLRQIEGSLMTNRNMRARSRLEEIRSEMACVEQALAEF